MAKIKLTKNELKVQKDALKMYRRYLPTLTLKKQQLQSEIRTIEAKAKAVRKEREDLEFGFREWIAVFSETDAFPKGIITVSNIRKGKGNIAGVDIPTFEGADFRLELLLFQCQSRQISSVHFKCVLLYLQLVFS